MLHRSYYLELLEKLYTGTRHHNLTLALGMGRGFAQMRRRFLRAFQSYEKALAKRPLTTQLVTGTVLVSLGDSAAQHLVERRDAHDWRRTGNMVLLRGLIHSSLIIYWYRFLATRISMPQASRYQRLAVQ